MSKGYYTIARKSECEIVINKSRFIGQAFHVSNEDEAVKCLGEVRNRFPDATHNCYAYTVGRVKLIQRFSDDGEPGGTAGMPILQVILQQDIQDVLVVVTRYFGGIKLGAGGLVRAYSKTAAEALDRAGKKKMTLSTKGTMTLDYSLLGTVEHFLRQKDIPVLKADYSDKVTLTLITSMEWSNFCNMITELCNGKVDCHELEQVYYSW